LEIRMVSEGRSSVWRADDRSLDSRIRDRHTSTAS
jgi:hypothetical protein